MRAYRGADPRDTRTIRVVLADDDSLFVEALAALLELGERIDVVGRARDGSRPSDSLRRRAPTSF
jgi:DNA-binding NarL/FixJ family response regulator